MNTAWLVTMDAYIAVCYLQGLLSWWWLVPAVLLTGIAVYDDMRGVRW